MERFKFCAKEFTSNKWSAQHPNHLEADVKVIPWQFVN